MKKKGFTLIELLAVIVILAILALIITPTISKIIENTKKEAFKQSVVGILRSGEYYIAKHVLETKGLEITYPIEFTCNGTSCSHDDVSLTFQGSTPKGGKIIVESRKEVIAEYITDGKFCASGTKLNLQIAKSCSDIDNTAPIISGSLEGKVIHLSITEEESGVKGYCVNTSDDSSSCNWIDNTNKSIDHELESAGTYYVFARDNKDNVSNMLTFTADIDAFCAYEPGHEFDFAYTGNVQTFDIPCDGLYKLEVWGAAGAYYGGAGGYSIGHKVFAKDEKLYIVAGGVGGSTSYTNRGSGGYNGGGYSYGQEKDGRGHGGGGGATHIAKVTGTLTTIGYNSFVTQGNGLIVAGGGGGGYNDVGSVRGGSAGGGSSNLNSTFGKGTDAGSTWTGGGGGGFYGGNKGSDYYGSYGGSSWVGGVPEIEYKGTTYTPSTTVGGNSGNGKAKITLMEY